MLRDWETLHLQSENEGALPWAYALIERMEAPCLQEAHILHHLSQKEPVQNPK